MIPEKATGLQSNSDKFAAIAHEFDELEDIDDLDPHTVRTTAEYNAEQAARGSRFREFTPADCAAEVAAMAKRPLTASQRRAKAASARRRAQAVLEVNPAAFEAAVAFSVAPSRAKNFASLSSVQSLSRAIASCGRPPRPRRTISGPSRVCLLPRSTARRRPEPPPARLPMRRVDRPTAASHSAAKSASSRRQR